MPKKALCSVLYDTSESEDLNLKEMLEMKHIRVVGRMAGCVLAWLSHLGAQGI